MSEAILNYTDALKAYVKCHLLVLTSKRKMTKSEEQIKEYKAQQDRMVAYYNKVVKEIWAAYNAGKISKEAIKERSAAAGKLREKTERLQEWLKANSGRRRQRRCSALDNANIRWPTETSINISQRRISIDTRMQASIKADYVKRAVTVSHIPVDDVRRLVAQELYATEFNMDYLRASDIEAAKIFLAFLKDAEGADDAAKSVAICASPSA